MTRDRRIIKRAAGAVLMTAVSVFVLCEKPKLLLYNRTPSVPVGWYVYAGRTPQRGELVAFRLPVAAHAYARSRGESNDVRLLKPVIAVGGDHVFTLGGELRVNGVSFGPIHAVDSAGRTLPRWQADRVLSADELLVGSTTEHSFDSRFFGPVHANAVLGVYRPFVVDSAARTPVESTPDRLPIHRDTTSSSSCHGG